MVQMEYVGDTLRMLLKMDASKFLVTAGLPVICNAIIQILNVDMVKKKQSSPILVPVKGR